MELIRVNIENSVVPLNHKFFFQFLSFYWFAFDVRN